MSVAYAERRFLVSRQSRLPKVTSSSAVAKTPRDASRLSVVSFNSTALRAQFLLIISTSASDLPVRTIRFCYVVFGVTSIAAVIHTIHGRPSLCIARDRAWLVSRCTQSRTTMTAYSAWRCRWSSDTRSQQNPAAKCNKLTTVQQLPIAKPDVR